VEVDALSVGLRALSFIALFQAGGAALFVARFGSETAVSGALIRKIGLVAALAGIVFAVGHYALEAARMAGEIAGMLDPSLQQLVLSSSASSALAWRVAGLLLIAIGLGSPSASGSSSTSSQALLTLLGVVWAAAAFALVGHTVESPSRWVLSLALIAHLLAVAFWFGGLVPLYLVSRRESLAAAAKIVADYSSIASRVVPALFIAGVLLAVLLLPGVAALASPYGLILLGKVTLFALLMALATLNKWHFGPAMARGDESAKVKFQRSVLAELTLISIVLAMTAVMTSLYSPE